MLMHDIVVQQRVSHTISVPTILPLKKNPIPCAIRLPTQVSLIDTPHYLEYLLPYEQKNNY